MNKVVYIIPGFTESTNLNEYKQIVKIFKSHNFKVIPITITWKFKTMSNYVEEFLSQLSHKKTDEVYLFGFSFGAMIAFISASKIQTKMIYLCSLSPYFKEDLKFLKKSWKNYIGKKRFDDFKNFSFNKLSKIINCKTILLLGDKEPIEVNKRVNDANKKIKNSELFIGNNTKHDISQKEYISKLSEIIRKYK